MKTLAWKKFFCASLILFWTIAGAEASYTGDYGGGGDGAGDYRQTMESQYGQYNQVGQYGQYGQYVESAKLPPLTPLSLFEFYQIGDTDLVITMQGRALPAPDITHFENNNTQIVMHGVTGARAVIERQDATPMVLDVSTQQAGPDYVITITTERPLQMRSLRGVAPSDTYSLRFATTQQQLRMMEEPLRTQHPQTLKAATGPFAANISVTLDVRDADLRDVFRLLAVQMKKNIIVHDSIPPGQFATMTLKNVPLSEVWGYLLKTYNLDYREMSKDTIVIGTELGISQVSGTEETHSYRVAYADAAAVASLLGNLTGITADKIVVDPRLRTVYVTAPPLKQQEAAIILQRMDNPGKQVMLHTRIFEFTDGASREVEQAINGVYDHWWFNYTGQSGMRGGFADDNRLGRNYIAPDPELYPFLPGMTDLDSPMQGVWREFDINLRAIEEKRKGKVLANPSVIAIDGEAADISLTESYPYSTGRDEQLNTIWEREIVGPHMNMTPIVGRDGYVTLKLTVETGEVIEMLVGSNGEEVPRTSKRTMTTTVRVRDGEPFVVGGLFRENKMNNTWRIPILGSLPLLGELFTYRSTRNDKTQVVVVVIPYVLDTPDISIESERVMFKQ